VAHERPWLARSRPRGAEAGLEASEGGPRPPERSWGRCGGLHAFQAL